MHQALLHIDEVCGANILLTHTKIVIVLEVGGVDITTFIISSSNLATGAVTASLSLTAILVLLVLLIVKELTLPAQTHRVQRLGQTLNVAIAPLLITFIIIAVFRVADVLV